MTPGHAIRLEELIRRFHDRWPNEYVEWGKQIVRGGQMVNGMSMNKETKKYEATSWIPEGMDVFFLRFGLVFDNDYMFEWSGENLEEGLGKLKTWLEPL